MKDCEMSTLIVGAKCKDGVVNEGFGNKSY